MAFSGLCKNCKQTISGTAKICSHCQAEQHSGGANEEPKSDSSSAAKSEKYKRSSFDIFLGNLFGSIFGSLLLFIAVCTVAGGGWHLALPLFFLGLLGFPQARKQFKSFPIAGENLGKVSLLLVIIFISLLGLEGSKARQQAEQYYPSHRSEILEKIKGLQKQKLYQEAKDYYRPYTNVDDEDLRRLIKENETTMKSEQNRQAAEEQAKENIAAEADKKRAQRDSDMENPTFIVSNLHLDHMAWHKSGFGVVALVDFSLQNKNDFDVKDIEITCYFYANSGTPLDHDVQTVFDIVKSHKTKHFTEINVGRIDPQTSSGSCEPTHASAVK